ADSCGNICVDSFVIEFDINAPPVCVLPADTIIYQCLPAKISLPVSATDEDGNLVKCEIISGPGNLSGGAWEYNTFRDETFEVTIRCVDQCGDTCVGSFEVKVDINQPPILTCPPDTTMPWVSILQIDVSVFDNDLSSNPNEIITYMLGPSSPGFATIDQNGRITLTPQGGDVCDHVIEVLVTDICGVADTCEINICVTNERPVAICDTSSNRICWGQTATGIISGNDPDSGPLSLQYSVASFDGPGTVDIDPQTGEYTWITTEDPAYISSVSGWTLCVKVSDNANLCDPCSPENADTCCVSILVVPTYRVCIETADDVLAAGPVEISISIDSSYANYPMAGWDFLFRFDNSALSILGASPGGFFTGNNWEYFTYRFGANGNCGTGCPGNEFRVVAFAETNDKFNNPSGYTNQSAGSSELFVIHFLVSADHTLNCQFIPISWLWYDCGDNGISSVTGDSLFISRFIYTGDNQYPWADNGAESIHDNDALFPTGDGAPGICMVDTGDGKPDPLRKIDFKNGGVIIICDSLIDARGDMNLNGLANEIADAVVFTSYFIKGISAFDISPDGQTAASDINADGIVLSVADLVLLIRIISGDAQPIPKLSHYSETVTIQAQGDILSGDYPMGAALFIFEGETEVGLIQDSPMRLETGMRDGNTYALILPDFERAKDAVIEVGPILSSSGVLLSVEAADYNGSALNIATKIMPTSFVVRQNYPNPFNPSTKISFDVAVATSWNITIYNITGQKVEEFNGYSEPGTVEVVWNAVGSSSGVYLYRVTAGAQTATRKMALLK
ncbi:MAG: T9SS type A sorting domain-containing protein, partial [candidate division Zixibacteria bacterium]|nr:T9SS type A sorting domain-containing protein [candidate division Zixibacteria bacterium]